MMNTILKIKRGSYAKLQELMQSSTQRFADGELFIAKDLQSLFYSDGTNYHRVGNIFVGSFDDMSVFSQKGALYFVTDTSRFKNTLWCYDGFEWILVSSTEEQEENVVELEALSNISKGDDVIAIFTGTSPNALVVSGEAAKNLSQIPEKQFVTVGTLGNTVTSMSQDVFDQSFYVTASRFDNGTIRIDCQKLQPNKSTHNIFTGSFSVGAQDFVQVVCEFGKIIVFYLKQSGSNQYTLNRLIGVVTDGTVQFTDSVGQNVLSMASVDRYSVDVVKANAECVCLYLDSGVVKAFVITDNGSTLTDGSIVVVTGDNGYAHLTADYDVVRNKIVWCAKKSGGRYAQIDVDGTSLTPSGSVNTYSANTPDWHIVYYSVNDATFFVTYKYNGIKGHSIYWTGVSYNVSTAVTVDSLTGFSDLFVAMLKTGQLFVAYKKTSNNNVDIFIGDLTGTVFNKCVSLVDLGTQSLMVQCGKYYNKLNSIVCAPFNDNLKFYVFAYNEQMRDIIPVMNTMFYLGYAKEDAVAGKNLLVHVVNGIWNPTPKWIPGTVYRYMKTTQTYNVLEKYENIGLSDYIAIHERCVLNTYA